MKIIKISLLQKKVINKFMIIGYRLYEISIMSIL